MAFLLVVAGSNEGDFHPLKKRSVSIGRSEECTIQIVDVEVSRRHMQVRYDEVGDGYLAVDEDSANGVFVNHAEIAGETPLSNGDIIRIGDSEIIYSEKDFIDRDSALEHYRRRTEHDRGTVIQWPGHGTGATRDDAYMTVIDTAIDDGDVTTGWFRKIAGDRYYFIVAE